MSCQLSRLSYADFWDHCGFGIYLPGPSNLFSILLRRETSATLETNPPSKAQGWRQRVQKEAVWSERSGYNLKLPEQIRNEKEKIAGVIQALHPEILYAGVVGSSLARKGRDIDVVAISKGSDEPSLFHRGNVSVLLLGKDWLTYQKHRKLPTGLIPSILFKSIQLSFPIWGDKEKVLRMLPQIRVREEDFTNVEIKRKRYERRDRKNYLVALVFEELLKRSIDLSEFEFDNVRLAKKLGLEEVARELEGLSF